MVDRKPFANQAHTLFWFPFKGIKISDNFYKIQNFLRAS